MNGSTNITLQAIATVIVQSFNELADYGISVPSAPGHAVPW